MLIGAGFVHLITVLTIIGSFIAIWIISPDYIVRHLHLSRFQSRVSSRLINNADCNDSNMDKLRNSLTILDHRVAQLSGKSEEKHNVFATTSSG